jgi:hypothetical protein
MALVTTGSFFPVGCGEGRIFLFGEASMSHHEVIRVGVLGARIVAVTRERVEYVDMEGQERVIDLEQCARKWVQWRDSLSPAANEPGVRAWNARCVGQRGALDRPPWAEFTNERKTRFEFPSYEALYGQLLTQLKQVGWHTFDAD